MQTGVDGGGVYIPELPLQDPKVMQHNSLLKAFLNNEAALSQNVISMNTAEGAGAVLRPELRLLRTELWRCAGWSVGFEPTQTDS